jgi:hypothetical protein
MACWEVRGSARSRRGHRLLPGAEAERSSTGVSDHRQGQAIVSIPVARLPGSDRCIPVSRPVFSIQVLRVRPLRVAARMSRQYQSTGYFAGAARCPQTAEGMGCCPTRELTVSGRFWPPTGTGHRLNTTCAAAGPGALHTSVTPDLFNSCFESRTTRVAARMNRQYQSVGCFGGLAARVCVALQWGCTHTSRCNSKEQSCHRSPQTRPVHGLPIPTGRHLPKGDARGSPPRGSA